MVFLSCSMNILFPFFCLYFFSIHFFSSLGTVYAAHLNSCGSFELPSVLELRPRRAGQANRTTPVSQAPPEESNAMKRTCENNNNDSGGSKEHFSPLCFVKVTLAPGSPVPLSPGEPASPGKPCSPCGRQHGVTDQQQR